MSFEVPTKDMLLQKARDEIRHIQKRMELASIIWGRLARNKEGNPIALKANERTNIAHMLGRAPKGWFLVSPQGPGQVYEVDPQGLPRDRFIVLKATEDMTVDIWVF